MVMKELNSRRVETCLTVCGRVPPDEFYDKRMKVILFLDKSKKKMNQRPSTHCTRRLSSSSSQLERNAFEWYSARLLPSFIQLLLQEPADWGEAVNVGFSGFLFDSPDNHHE